MLSSFGLGTSNKNLNEQLLPVEEKATPTDGPKRIPASERLQRYMESTAVTAESSNPQLAQFLRTLSPVSTVVLQAVMAIAPIYAWLYGHAYALYKRAPTNIIQMVFGVALCFFGGTFTASIAAIEAFRQMGFKKTLTDLHEVMTHINLIKDANKKDDLVDADKDGIADVDQIAPAELAKRKINLAMTTIKEPQKLQMALGSLWAAYLAVLATLKLQFAQTTAIALGIVEVVQFPLSRVLAPLLAQALGPDLKHWVETLLDTAIKFVAVVFAWYLQMVISAFYSALRGGRTFALALCEVVHEQGWGHYVERLPGVAKPFHPDTSFLDEIIGYTLGAAGFVWQITSGFSLPFPLNLALLPLTIVEWFLRWQVTFAAPGK